MLIEFKVSNFWSIYKKQTLSMVASPSTELEDNLCISDGDFKTKSGTCYGNLWPKCWGKSNLLNALAFMKMFILSSAKEYQLGDKIHTQSFSFDKVSATEPSEFEITFIKDKIRYQYGFTADVNRIFEEWLFAYPSGHAQKWFSRIYNKKTDEYSWKFSQRFFKSGKQVSDLTSSNVLFLSNAVKLNNKQLAPIFDWFLHPILCFLILQLKKH